MTAGVYNIQAKQNNHFKLELTLKDDQGNPIDNTNYQGAFMQVRKSTSSTNTIFDLSDANGDIVLGGSDGKVTVEIPAQDLINKNEFNEGVYDLVLYDQNSEAWNVLTGSFQLVPGVTKSTP